MSTSQTISIDTDDGVTLTADVTGPSEPTADAVLCHPHPAYGGDRFNTVVDALFTALPQRQVRTLRFDFRDALRQPSDDVTAGLNAAASDVAAAISALRPDRASRPLVVLGYSYGALATLEAVTSGVISAPDALALIAPPLTVRPIELTAPVPTLIAVPQHDQFCDPDTAARAVAAWPAEIRSHIELLTIPMTDHFMAGQIAATVDRTLDWLPL
ncbi:MAG: alpha/beta fold hydrolase [Actinomycetota bacterium]